MPISRKVNVNIDKLRLCYKANNDSEKSIFDKMSQYETNSIIKFPSIETQDNNKNESGFEVHIINDGRGKDKNFKPTQIECNIYVYDRKRTLFGSLTLNQSAKYDGLHFLAIDNRALYQQVSADCNQRYNILCYLDYITSKLGLVLNNITQMEVALDVNYNAIYKIRKLISNCQDYIMIYNNKKIEKADEDIDNYGELFSRTRAKLSRQPTLYFKQIKDRGLELRIYNKSKEVKQKNNFKHYVEEWNDFGTRGIYRLEMDIYNEQFRFWESFILYNGYPAEWAETENLGGLLQLDQYKFALWHFCASRLIYFRRKGRNGRVIHIAHVAMDRDF